MGSSLQWTTQTGSFVSTPSLWADAACRYQRLREVEARQLALMAQHNLLEEWTPEVRATVLEARVQVRAAREARGVFRDHVRRFVCGRRDARDPLSAVLRQTREMLHLLQSTGTLHDDGGWLEAEVLEWAIEDYENPA